MTTTNDPHAKGRNAALQGEWRGRLLINCSNLHVGGGIAVAASFIDCLSKDLPRDLDIALLVSSSVRSNLASLNAELSGFVSCETANYFGLRSIWQGLHRHFAPFDVVFTVFGPAYTFSRVPHHICGFAQALIIYPRDAVERGMRPWERLREWFKFGAQELFFARADELIVELEHVKLGLARRRTFKHMPIHVVHNTVDAVFRDSRRWSTVRIPESAGAVKLGVVSRNYVHKNLACLPMLQDTLRKEYGLQVAFYVTFTDAEWSACSDGFRASIANVGELMLSQSPSFYSSMDGVIFPSLLESFSAVPLEAMCMRRPLFASDLPFIRDCCQEHANYFDPLDVASMAKVIADYYLRWDDSRRNAMLGGAHDFLQRYPSPQERARSYIKIARDAVMRRRSPDAQASHG